MRPFRFSIFRLLASTLLFLSVGQSFATPSVKPDSAWMNRKFSMFIHWGLYSRLGGIWDGQPVTSGYSEQIQSHGGIFSDYYAAVADRFVPVLWQADSVVALAKRSGARSIVFTSKHHDGFCMYHSRYTDYNIVDATPFHRDVMRELADACERQGMGFGVYFSLIDWHFPEAYPISSHNADPLTPAHYEYNRRQVEEIMTGYGKISEIWFDMGSLTPAQSRGLYRLVDSLQPGCMVSGRLGNDCSDFCVMADNDYPTDKIGVPWQTAASIFDETWGFRMWQVRDSVEVKAAEKIRSLVRVVSRGGNYLLNIGPTGEGEVVPYEREVFKRIGAWLRKYGEGIYGTTANPFDSRYMTGEVTVKGNQMYLFADTSATGGIRLNGLRGKILNAETLDGLSVAIAREQGEWTLQRPAVTDKESPLIVIRLDLAEGWQIEPLSPHASDRMLTTEYASPIYGYSGIDYYSSFLSTIGYEWGFHDRRSALRPEIRFTEQELGRKIRLEMDDSSLELVLDDSDGQTLTRETLRPSGAVWGEAYSHVSGGVFSRRPAKSITTEGIDINDPDGDWHQIHGFRLCGRYEQVAHARSSLLVYQTIESDKAQTVPVRIESGEGVLIQLNGHEITAHLAPQGEKESAEIVLLPLKKGTNRLLLKAYNRFGNRLRFGILPMEEATIYRLRLPQMRLDNSAWHRCRILPLDTPSKNAPARLNNLRIEF